MKLPHRRKFLHLAAGAATLPAVARAAWAQAYPSRPVRIIVGFPAGGATDILARITGQWLSERLGQQFIIENRTGAATNIATEIGKPRLDLGIGKAGVDLLVEFLDDLCRRGLGRADAEPGARLAVARPSASPWSPRGPAACQS